MNHEVAQLLEATRTRAGMTVNAKLEEMQHRTNVTRSAEGRTFVNLEPHTFHRESRDAFTVSPAGFLGVYGEKPGDCPSCYSRQSSHAWLFDPFESICFSTGAVTALTCSSTSLSDA